MLTNHPDGFGGNPEGAREALQGVGGWIQGIEGM